MREWLLLLLILDFMLDKRLDLREEAEGHLLVTLLDAEEGKEPVGEEVVACRGVKGERGEGFVEVGQEEGEAEKAAVRSGEGAGGGVEGGHSIRRGEGRGGDFLQVSLLEEVRAGELRVEVDKAAVRVGADLSKDGLGLVLALDDVDDGMEGGEAPLGGEGERDVDRGKGDGREKVDD